MDFSGTCSVAVDVDVDDDDDDDDDAEDDDDDDDEDTDCAYNLLTVSTVLCSCTIGYTTVVAVRAS